MNPGLPKSPDSCCKRFAGRLFLSYVGLALLASATTLAQDSTGRWARPNVLKTNLLAPISLFYERAITRRFALQTNVRWLNGGSQVKSRFVNAAIEGRFYTNGLAELAAKAHPAGFYVGPYLKARRLNYVNEIGQGIGQPLARDEVIIKSLGFGAIVGHQWVGRRGFTGDVFIGGGAMPYVLSSYRHTLRYSTVTSDSGYDYYAMDYRLGISLGYAF